MLRRKYRGFVTCLLLGGERAGGVKGDDVKYGGGDPYLSRDEHGNDDGGEKEEGETVFWYFSGGGVEDMTYSNGFGWESAVAFSGCLNPSPSNK